MTDNTNVGIVGYLTGEPDLRTTVNGKLVVDFDLSVKPYTRPGEPEAETHFWKCVAFASLAQHVCESLRKGDRVLAVGTTKSETWTGRDGRERTTVKLVCEGVGPDLRFATVKVEQPAKAAKPAPAVAASHDEEEPF